MKRVVLAIVVVAAAAWIALSRTLGPVEVLVVNDGSQPLVVQVVEVSEIDDRVVIAEWREHRLDPGQSVVESRDPSGDSIPQLRVVRDDGRTQQYTLRYYLGGLSRLRFRLRLTEEGLSQAQVREGGRGEFEDVVWDFGVSACGDDEPAPSVEVPPWARVAPEQIAEAKKHGVPVAFENDLGMRFVLIPAGTFSMGSPEDEEWRGPGDRQHEVTLTRPFYLQVCEVTNAQYRKMDVNHDSGEYLGLTLNEDDQPVDVGASHEKAVAYTRWLSRKDRIRTYRLPTEAEWEYACRAGTKTKFWWGEAASGAASRANAFDANLRNFIGIGHPESFPGDDGYSVAAPVGSFSPNPWGLNDMLGNVWEWCADFYGGDYPEGPVQDPTGPLTGPSEMETWHVRRGGYWFDHQWLVTCANRVWLNYDHVPTSTGFRLVSPLPESSQ